MEDPDAQPLNSDGLAGMRRVPRAKTLNLALGLTQEELSVRYQIHSGRFETGVRAEPDQPARAYLKAIAGDPKTVQRALSHTP